MSTKLALLWIGIINAIQVYLFNILFTGIFNEEIKIKLKNEKKLKFKKNKKNKIKIIILKSYLSYL
jgi:hypothetical protein